MDLSLPRVLCLHGGGTNARIFQLQCRVLQHALRNELRFVFAEAPFFSEPGPDVTSVYANFGPFKSWLRMRDGDEVHRAEHVVDSIESSILAAMCVDDMLGGRGAWIGMLGFSQGAKLAASILHTQESMQRNGQTHVLPDFQFAVLLAGRGPLVWLQPELPIPAGLVSADHLSTCTKEIYTPTDTREHILTRPTLHVHGLKDPGLGLHRRLCQRYCEPKSMALVEWDGIHRVVVRKQDVKLVVEQMRYMISNIPRLQI